MLGSLHLQTSPYFKTHENPTFYLLFLSVVKVISSSLKTLGKLLNVTREEFITELFSYQTLSGEIPTKQARLDSSDPWKDVQQEMTVKRVDSEKLALVLSQRLRDSRWEVKDSSLEFVASLLQVNHG